MLEGEFRRLRMVCNEYAKRGSIGNSAQVECAPRSKSRKVEKEKIFTIGNRGSKAGGLQVVGHCIYEGGGVFELDLEYSNGKNVNRKVENMYRLQ